MRKIASLFIILISSLSWANNNPSEIYQNLLKLKSLKRILYIAAHPDDENTRALAYFSLGENAETAYLSLTRGDGGQNLIGDELSEKLGLLRTQELLAARSHDKATQFFSRAVDFGYSKSAEESFEKWGKDEILSDVVYVIRKFQPDVIITRFPPDARGGHGHHTASAMLAIEAFSKAADPYYKPEEVKEIGVWETTSVYWNSSSWWDKTLPEKSKDNPNYLVQDIGGYNPYLGMSYNEIGTIARSQHKCQGFGAILERGSRIEYFEHLVGKKLNSSFFELQKSNWKSLVDDSFELKINSLLENFDFIHPENNVTKLIQIRKELLKIKNHSIRAEKLRRCDAIIKDCLGIYIELKNEDFAQAINQSAKANLRVINRSNTSVFLKGIQSTDDTFKFQFNDTLFQNILIEKEIILPKTSTLSNPYWLENDFKNIFVLSNNQNLGKAENQSIFKYDVLIDIEGQTFAYPITSEYIYRDPSYGERRRKLISTPNYSINLEQKLTIVKPGKEKIIKIKVHTFSDSLNGKFKLNIPKGWQISPKEIEFTSNRKHEELFFEINIKALDKSERGVLTFEDAQTGEKLKSYVEIAYDHISTQTVFTKSQMECIKLDAQIKPGKIAYIKGVKDAVPNGIRELGFQIEEYNVEDLSELNLNEFKTVVLGIRIYNVNPELKNFDQKLFDYVENGGKVIMQYNTASRWVRSTEYGPKPFKLGRKRVTEENSKVNFLNPKHPIFNSPNKITQSDFENWVQERGLYFAETWHSSYEPLISWNDKGEEPTKGALIVMNHGKGQFIYTGISFFRELPNGVEGAFKLFANLLSY